MSSTKNERGPGGQPGPASDQAGSATNPNLIPADLDQLHCPIGPPPVTADLDVTEGPYATNAVELFDAGWSPLPIPPRKKSPPPNGYTGDDGREPSRPDVQTWIEDKPGSNIAVRLRGDVLGLDVDDYADKHGGRTLTKLEKSWGALPPTFTLTSRGAGAVSGIQLFRVPPGLAWPDEAGPGIDIVRRSHRYVMWAPSVHPSGEVYVLYGLDRLPAGVTPHPGELPMLPDAWIEGLTAGRAAAQHQSKLDVDPAAFLTGLEGAGDEPDAVMTRALGKALAVPPGKSRHDWMKERLLALVRCAEQGHPGGLAALRKQRMAYIMSVTDRDDSVSVAAEFDRALRGACGLVAADPTPTGQRPSATVHDAERGQMVATTGDAGSSSQPLPPTTKKLESRTDWLTAEPLPLSRTQTLPVFPVNLLPEPFAAMVSAVAEFCQTDPGMPGTTVLGMLAACAGGRVEVEARAGWREPTNLFTVTVAASGERKSAVQAVMSAPLHAAERELSARAAGQILEADTTRDIARKAAERAKQKAGQADPKDANTFLAEAISAEMAAVAVTVPVLPRLLADDVTPEALGSLLANQGGRLAVVSAEGGIFAIIGGRYSGNVPNLDIWLKGHAGDRVRIDRKGRDPEFIDRPALTVSLMVQPRILMNIGQHADMRGSGLLARFLYCLPTTRVGTRNVRPDPVPDNVANAYTTALHDLAVDLAQWEDLAVIILRPDAVDVLLAFAELTESRLGPGSDLAHIADWGNKLTGETVRIAGLLHLAQHREAGVRRPLDADTMTAAVALAGYYTDHALAAFDMMQIDPVTALARAVLEAAKAKHLKRFTVRDLRRSYVQHRNGGEMTSALAMLTEHGWLRAEPTPESTGPGRKPSPGYEVHPDLFESK